MTIVQLLGLVVVGTVAGFDLVSGPQILLARPIIAGTLSGLVLGDVESGILVGGILELYALEVLPVGATRYPDHGPGTIGAVWLTSRLGLPAAGYGILIALLVAEIGGWSLQLLRRMNGRALLSATPALEAGDPAASAGLQLGGALRDVGRAALLTGLGLFLCWIALPLIHAHRDLDRFVALVTIAGGLAGAVAGAFRTAGRSARLALLAVGVVLGWFLGGVVGLFPWILS